MNLDYNDFEKIEFKNQTDFLNEVLTNSIQTKAMLSTVLEMQAVILRKIDGKSKEETHELINDIYDRHLDNLLRDLIDRTT